MLGGGAEVGTPNVLTVDAGLSIIEKPAISIVKGSALNVGTDALATPGDIITYSYEVSNIGNVALSNVTVTEAASAFTGSGTLPSPSFVSATLSSPAGSLKVGEKATYTASYAITAADILAGKIDNQAFTAGVSPKNVTVKDTSDSKNPADYNETGTPGTNPAEKDKTGTLIPKNPVGSIGDFVFLDNDNNNVQSTGDTPVVGVKVYLLNSSGVKIDSTTTGNDGKYLFANLPLATYSIQFVAPAGQQFVTAVQGGNIGLDSDAGTDGKSGSITLTVGTPNVLTVDAGLKPILGSIGDKVFADTNKDGLQDSGEPGVDGVKVILWNSDASGNPTTKRDSTITAGGGLYLFSNLPKGDYVVQFIKSTIPSTFAGFTSQSGAVNDATNSDANLTDRKSVV